MKVGHTRIPKDPVKGAGNIGKQVTRAAIKEPLNKGNKGLPKLKKLGGYK